MTKPKFSDSVFVNCPFDSEYEPLHQAILFTVFDCGFVARSALEINDSGQVRIDKINQIIRASQFGIHDISRTELDPTHSLPRFNMPLELGLFLGAKTFGSGNQKRKSCLILDCEKNRYQKFLSDISGQDVKSHDNDPTIIIRLIRDWLRDHSKRESVPGGAAIARRYRRFGDDLPQICDKLEITVEELTFNDYCHIVSTWLTQETAATVK